MSRARDIADIGTDDNIETSATETIFEVSNVEKMRINATGLGVGTASPVSPVTSEGDISIGSTVDADNADLGEIAWWNRTNAGVGSGTSFVNDVAAIQGQMEGTGNNSGGSLHFFTKSDGGSKTQAMIIDGAQKVAINKASTTEFLEVHGAIGSSHSAANFGAGDARANIDFATGAGGTRIGSVNGDYGLVFLANSGEKARINSNGDLIVGGTASVVKNASGNDVAGKFVDVQPGTAVTGGVVVGSTGRGGTASADYRQGFFLRRSDGWSTSQSGMWKGSHSTGSDINYWERMKIGNSGGGGHIDFEINDDTKMTLSTGGRLGIGTLTGASARLHLLNSAAGEQCLYSDATHATYANINTLLVVTRAANSAYAFLQTKSSGGSDVEHNLRGDGEAYADGSFSGSGADYSEYFEWADGNSDDEDRRGLSVVLDNEKIRAATDDDDASQIIGVVSGNPCVVGDNAWNKWRGKYLRNDFGGYDLTEDGDRQLNPDFDADQEYVPREDRKEWSAVGLVGKLRVRKGQPIGDRWIKMRDINSDIEEYLVR